MGWGGFEVIPEGVSPSYIEDIHLTMLMDRDWGTLHTSYAKKGKSECMIIMHGEARGSGWGSGTE